MGAVRFVARSGTPAVRLVVHRSLIALALITHTLRPGSDGSGRRLADEVGRRLSPAARDAHTVLHDEAGGFFFPHTLVPSLVAGSAVREAVADADRGLTTGLVTDYFGDRLTPAWERALGRPERWLADAGLGLAEVMPVVDRLLAVNAGRLRVEEQRLRDAATDPAGRRVFLSGVAPRLRAEGDHLALAWSRDITNVFDGDILVAPVFTRPGSVQIVNDLTNLVVGYGALTGLPPSARPDTDRLANLLGDLRARIVRALRDPMTTNALAAAVRLQPSSLSYQLDRLEAAGLVERVRLGRQVWVVRTAAADTLEATLGR